MYVIFSCWSVTFKILFLRLLWKVGCTESMVMKFHGNVRGEIRVNFLALLSPNPTFWCVVPSHSSKLFVRTFVWTLTFQVFLVPGKGLFQGPSNQHPLKQGGSGTEPEPETGPSEPFFPKPKAEPEPPELFSRNRNRNRNRSFLLNCTETQKNLFLQRNR